MRPTKERGVCPLCGDPNAYTVVYCNRCSYRLPWADELEGIDRSAYLKTLEETKLDKVLKKKGLLPERTLRCRYCEGVIEVDAKQCPQCKLWLVADYPTTDLDPWQHDYDDRATKKVDMIGPRAGCFSIVACLALGIGVFLLKTAVS